MSTLGITATITQCLPGNVHVTGRRIVAAFVDGVVVGILYVALAAGFGTITSGDDPLEYRAALPLAANIAYGVLVVGYFIVLEAYKGQTVGKMLVGIQVVAEGSGRPPGLGRATVRTALRLVDGLFSYLVAFVVVLSTQKRQRLGDLLAHTVVVRSA